MKRKTINSQLSNVKTFAMYCREFLDLAENVFEFINLSDFIDISYMNKILLRQGSIAFFKDEILDELIALPYTTIGPLDVYGRPKTIIVTGMNGYSRKLTSNEFVIMYDNNGRYPLYLNIKQRAERCAFMKRVIDINISQQRTPRAWKIPQNKEKSFKDILDKIDAMEDVFLTYDTLEIEEFSSILAPAPFVGDKIYDIFNREYSEFLSLIGVANMNIQKKERLITDEASFSMGGTIAARYNRYQPRMQAVNLINKKFGTNIEVRFYDHVPSTKIGDNEEGVLNDIS